MKFPLVSTPKNVFPDKTHWGLVVLKISCATTPIWASDFCLGASDLTISVKPYS